MRVLVVHNFYQQWGGEDECAIQETNLLKAHGHEVDLLSRHNDEIKKLSKLRMGALFFEPTWSPKSFRVTCQAIKSFKPDVIHCHNFFPLISPAIIYAASKYNVPVVQTLHDWRLLCPTGWLFRNGKVCEECIDKTLLSGIRYRCYHESSIQTASVALMLATHRTLKTWDRRIDAYIALTEHGKAKFVQGGLPAEKIHIRPNFFPQTPNIEMPRREYALFVGRLSEEKGIKILLEAWQYLPEIPLVIVGDGNLMPWAKSFIQDRKINNVRLVGFVPLDEVLEYQKKAMFLVMPSVWYETFGRVILEAYSVGTPVIASRLGAMAELVDEGSTGLCFTPGDATDLQSKVNYAMNNRDTLAVWGMNARRKLLEQYSPDVAYEKLMCIYGHVIVSRKRSHV